MAKKDGTNGKKIGRHARNPSSKLQAQRSLRNERLRRERHAAMLAQHAEKRTNTGMGLPGGMKVPRGTARALRRKPLQLAWAAKHA